MSDENILESRFFGEMVITDLRLQRELPGAYRDAALQLIIHPPVQLQGEMDTILFPLKHMESTKLVKTFSFWSISWNFWCTTQTHAEKLWNLLDSKQKPWWSDQSSLELPIRAHQKKKKYTEKIKKSVGEKQVLEKENSKENYLQGNKEEESRAGERQAAAQHEVLRITATGRGHLIFFPPKKTERKISSDRKTTTCKQEFVRRQFKHETCVHLM